MKTISQRTRFIIFLLGLILFSGTVFGQEMVIINDTVEWDMSSMYGYHWWYGKPSGTPDNWRTPYDYYDGQTYTRYEIIEVATSADIGIQIGYWQNPQDPEWGELMELNVEFGGVGDVITNNSSPSDWYKIYGGVDFTRMDDIYRFGVILIHLSPRSVLAPTNWGGNDANWANRDNWFPMKVYVTAVAVAEGHVFSGWDNYVGVKPPTPDYGIDFLNGTTDEAVPSTDEYSINPDMSGAISGTGVPVTLTLGLTYYFRTKAQGINPRSDIQPLPVPGAPDAPSFDYSKITEKTTTAVATTHEYSLNSDMSDATDGTGSTVTVIPGETMYFRKKATAGEFASEIQELEIDPRPASPVYTINYSNSTTVEIIPDNIHYSSLPDMSNPSSGTNSSLPVTPGSDLYFRTVGTTLEFASEIFELVVPDKPLLTSVSGNTVIELPFTVHIDFSGTVTGFNVTDIQIDNGVAVNLRDEYDFDVVGADLGSINISIDANVVNEGNFASDPLNITYTDEVSVIDYNEAGSFNVYPNPNDGSFYIDLNNENNEIAEIIISDITGKIVFRDIYNMNTIFINAQDLSNGYYFLKISRDNSIRIQKIIIQK